jgi:hypothetical protein
MMERARVINVREGVSDDLGDLCEQVVACGSPSKSVGYTDEWVEPAWRRSTSELPQDVVCLQAVGSTEVGHAVVSTLDAFATSHRREMARLCTKEY